LTIFKVFTIAAAHRLPNAAADHKCARLHGHTFRIELHVTGPVDASTGWVMDFADITAAFQPLHQALDHVCLNDIEGLENPTSENLARWIWKRLQATLPGLAKIVVQEGRDSGCIYEGEGGPALS
jgi:6-pyruvoyltetrahydropterin/6-carboxytetrahydropterin synthase